jgi:hypothetical protein
MTVCTLLPLHNNSMVRVHYVRGSGVINARCIMLHRFHPATREA